jgi:hypothetical protein
LDGFLQSGCNFFCFPQWLTVVRPRVCCLCVCGPPHQPGGSDQCWAELQTALPYLDAHVSLHKLNAADAAALIRNHDISVYVVKFSYFLELSALRDCLGAFVVVGSGTVIFPVRKLFFPFCALVSLFVFGGVVNVWAQVLLSFPL